MQYNQIHCNNQSKVFNYQFITHSY